PYFSNRSPSPRSLHSFPTRRSSDLLLRSSPGMPRMTSSTDNRRRTGALPPRPPRFCPAAAADGPILASVPTISRTGAGRAVPERSEEHTSELQSPDHLVCRLLLEKK